MYLLFAISLLGFLSLIAASLVIARHVRPTRNWIPRQQTFAQHLKAAASTYFSEGGGNFTEPESPRLQAHARNSSRFSKGY